VSVPLISNLRGSFLYVLIDLIQVGCCELDYISHIHTKGVFSYLLLILGYLLQPSICAPIYTLRLETEQDVNHEACVLVLPSLHGLQPTSDHSLVVLPFPWVSWALYSVLLLNTLQEAVTLLHLGWWFLWRNKVLRYCVL